MTDELVMRLEQKLKSDEQRRIANAPSAKLVRLREAGTSWIAEWKGLDIAMCLHTPRAMNAAQGEWSAEWLQRHVSAYFSTLDRRIYKGKGKRGTLKLSRVVVLENTAGVGWHVHALVGTPQHLTQAELIVQLSDAWHWRVDDFCHDGFRDKLFWAEPVTSNYAGYSVWDTFQIGDVAAQDQHRFIDLENTHHA